MLSSLSNFLLNTFFFANAIGKFIFCVSNLFANAMKLLSGLINLLMRLRDAAIQLFVLNFVAHQGCQSPQQLLFSFFADETGQIRIHPKPIRILDLWLLVVTNFERFILLI